MVLPERIELSTSPLPRGGISRKGAETLALAVEHARNVPRIDGYSVGIPSVFRRVRYRTPALRPAANSTHAWAV
jgi:hypothetical protein